MMKIPKDPQGGQSNPTNNLEESLTPDTNLPPQHVVLAHVPQGCPHHGSSWTHAPKPKNESGDTV